MGVPAFYTWLTRQVPNVIRAQVGDCENVYVDMNSVIHPCCHHDGVVIHRTEEDMFKAVMAEIELIVETTRPEKLLFLAIDGVAPAAKMVQQRERRLRSIQDSTERLEVENKIRAERIESGLFVPPANDALSKGKWDSNVITPGTEFMERLSNHLKKATADRIASGHRLWKNLTVVVADANVPGEGEHKILQFMRTQDDDEEGESLEDDGGSSRSKMATEPKKRRPINKHCIVGDDADLTMLGLVLHKERCIILRNMSRAEGLLMNRVIRSRFRTPLYSLRGGLDAVTKQRESVYTAVDIDRVRRDLFMPVFEDINLTAEETRCAIDDIIILFMLGGNDFLPHLPTLDVRTGAMSRIMYAYSSSILEKRDDNGEYNFIVGKDYKLDLDSLGAFMECLADLEEPPSQSAVRASYPEGLVHRKYRYRPPSMMQCKQFERTGTCTKGSTCQHLHGDKIPNAHRLMGLRNVVLEYAGAIASLAEKGQTWKRIAEHTERLSAMAPPGVQVTIQQTGRGKPLLTFEGLKTQMDRNHIMMLVRQIGFAYAKKKQKAMEIFLVAPSPKQVMDHERRQRLVKIRKAAYEDDMSLQVDEYVDAISSYASKSDRTLFAQPPQQAKKKGEEEEQSKQPEPSFTYYDSRVYYQEKFGVDTETEAGRLFVKGLAEDYVRGMQFVTRYYLSRLPHWDWEYSHHYAPMLRDMMSALDELKAKDKYDTWPLSTPASPVEQLMTVLPHMSSAALPAVLAKQMKDPNSRVKSMYPDSDSIVLDPNGRYLRYQWVARLPPLDRSLIKEVVDASRPSWGPEVLRRDATQPSLLIGPATLVPKLHGGASQPEARDATPPASGEARDATKEPVTKGPALYRGSIDNVELTHNRSLFRAQLTLFADKVIHPPHRRHLATWTRGLVRLMHLR